VIEDQACSSLVCLNEAVKALQAGKCERALVCGVDKFGHSKTETNALRVSCVLLQKRLDCRRVYAKLMDAKIGRHSPALIQNVHAACGVNPGHVAYVESYAAEARDCGAEYKALLHGAERTLPLYVGSRMWQGGMRLMSGLCALIRMVIAAQRRVLPACASMPVTCLSAAGSPTLVKENVKFAGGLMALDALCRNNSFYFLLQPNTMNVATKLSETLV
jgi:hypothetical protein